MNIRIVDARGRVALGKRFANQLVRIEYIDPTDVHIKLAGDIPTEESWLLRNAKARKLLKRGLAEAAAGTFSANPPDLVADRALASKKRSTKSRHRGKNS